MESITSNFNITINKSTNSKIDQMDFSNIVFGKNFTDNMVEMNFDGEKWSTPELKPYGQMSISPACSGLHYGQSIFEGMKAYHHSSGKVSLFRPFMNAKRFNISAERMGMPTIDEEIFVESIKTLLDIDRAWVPKGDGESLYIRPYMFANDPYIGVRKSLTYKFLIFCAPAGLYYSKPINVKIAEHYSRSMDGGTGFAKAAGNYAATLMPTNEVKKESFDQILWTDSKAHKYVQEIGTMNVFFVLNDKIVTPSTDGNILKGVTRDSIIQLIKAEGMEVEEKFITVDEVVNWSKAGKLQETFGTGTAASVSMIESLNYKGEKVELHDKNFTWSTKLKNKLNDIKYGNIEDEMNWIHLI